MQLDKDLQSIQEARRLVEQVAAAQREFEKLPQGKIDAIVTAMAAAARRQAEHLARMAVQETGYGNVPDKIAKNLFSTDIVYNYIKDLKTVGILREDRDNKIIEIGTPMGVVAAIIPSTNPTSTTIFKILIALKAGNGIVLSPHPAAARCINETARIMHEAAVAAGAPRGIIACMSEPTIEGTQALMKHDLTSVVLATGGMGLVKAAYSSGKPAIGVGPGNVPAFIERTADVAKAAREVIFGASFDNGVLCCSENAVILDEPIKEQAIAELKKNGGYFLSEEETAALERVIVTPQKTLNTKTVGKSAEQIAAMAGIKVPPGTRCLITAELKGVGRDYPLSIEKLSPTLALYVVDGWRTGCRRCIEILNFGGLGHTLALHTNDPEVVKAFGLEKPAFRIVVNTNAALGAIGYTTNLVPSMTLGCGTKGGNITSDNIGPLHLINIKRVAYETRQYSPERREVPVTTSAIAGVSRDLIRQIVDEFLSRRPGAAAQASNPASQQSAEPADTKSRAEAQIATTRRAVDFVSEEDVRRALSRGEKICIGPKTIITPSARELGAEKDVFVYE